MSATAVRYYCNAYGGAFFARKPGGPRSRARWAWHYTGGGLVPRQRHFGWPASCGHIHEYVTADGMYWQRRGSRCEFIDPDHGTTWKYREHGCECARCIRASRRDWRQWKALQRPNGAVRQDTALVRRHMYFLLSQGFTLRGISRASGIACSTVARIWAQHQTQCTHRVAQAILGVTLDQITVCDKVPGWRVHKMVATMTSAGVTHRQLGKALRYKHPRGVYRLTNGREAHYTTLTFRRVALLYRTLAMSGLVPASVLEEVGAL